MRPGWRGDSQGGEEAKYTTARYTKSYVCLVFLSCPVSFNDVYEICLNLLPMLSCPLHNHIFELVDPDRISYDMFQFASRIGFVLEHDLEESKAFVTYIITNATVSTLSSTKCRLIVLSIKCRTGELGTLPDNFLDSVQEISLGRHFSS